jgi:hypothetical protein
MLFVKKNLVRYKLRLICRALAGLNVFYVRDFTVIRKDIEA